MASKYGTGSVALSRQRLLESRRADAAAKAYSIRFAEASSRLMQADAALKDHSDHQAEQPRNWGFAGDLETVAARLGDVLNALGRCACGQFPIAEYGEHCPSEGVTREESI